MEDLVIRDAGAEDVNQAADLIVRMKRLNGEFDPLFRVVDDARDRATRYLNESMGREGKLVLVAVAGGRVFAVLRAEVKDRVFYEPSMEGDITDFYILPEARRKAIGKEMIDVASERLKKMGAQVIVAEFPAQNEIAVKFYGKRGFRALVNTFAREESGEGQ